MTDDNQRVVGELSTYSQRLQSTLMVAVQSKQKENNISEVLNFEIFTKEEQQHLEQAVNILKSGRDRIVSHLL